MDPDQTNAPGALDWSRSIRIQIKRSGIEESGSGLGQPDPSMRIKGVLTRFHSFLKTLFSFFSSSLRRSLLFVWTLTLIRFKPTQKHVNHSLISSSYHPKHESVTRERMHPLNQRESRFLSHGFRTVFWSYFLILHLFWWNPYGFIGLQRFLRLVNR